MAGAVACSWTLTSPHSGAPCPRELPEPLHMSAGSSSHCTRHVCPPAGNIEHHAHELGLYMCACRDPGPAWLHAHLCLLNVLSIVDAGMDPHCHTQAIEYEHPVLMAAVSVLQHRCGKENISNSGSRGGNRCQCCEPLASLLSQGSRHLSCQSCKPDISRVRVGLVSYLPSTLACYCKSVGFTDWHIDQRRNGGTSRACITVRAVESL
jgi:hypothetical protein